MVKVKNWRKEIDKALLDEQVNIKIAPLVGDYSMSMYATVLKPGSKVTAHVHQHGVELYHILKGAGEIYTDKTQDDCDLVYWQEPIKVIEGDAFSIEPGLAHQLKNTSSSEDLVLIFVCPQSHLKEDRRITNDYQE